jgi:hypothetical protein
VPNSKIRNEYDVFRHNYNTHKHYTKNKKYENIGINYFFKTDIQMAYCNQIYKRSILYTSILVCSFSTSRAFSFSMFFITSSLQGY